MRRVQEVFIIASEQSFEGGQFSIGRIALEQVTEVVRFDVHLHMNREGQRYIERISEIVPDTESPEGTGLWNLCGLMENGM